MDIFSSPNISDTNPIKLIKNRNLFYL